MWAALATLDSFVDLSDPDTALPNSVHAFQAPTPTYTYAYAYAQTYSTLPVPILYPHIALEATRSTVFPIYPPRPRRGCARRRCPTGCS